MARHSLMALLLAAALFLAGPTWAPNEVFAQGCLSQGEARAAVANGQAAPFSRFSRNFRDAGDVVSSQLCSAGGGRLIYVFNLVLGNGQVSRKMIDALSGAPLN